MYKRNAYSQAFRDKLLSEMRFEFGGHIGDLLQHELAQMLERQQGNNTWANVGSRVNVDALPGAAHDPTVWSVKPICNLWKLRAHLESRFLTGKTPRVAVVGGGPTGSEVAANVMALVTTSIFQ